MLNRLDSSAQSKERHKSSTLVSAVKACVALFVFVVVNQCIWCVVVERSGVLYGTSTARLEALGICRSDHSATLGMRG